MVRTRRLILILLAGLLIGLASSWIGGISAQRQKPGKQKETYTRPKPTEPIKPYIPDANRFQDDKVFLENADSLYRPAGGFEEYQIVKGTVKFRQGNMWMFCDSAYYYPDKNSMDAFGHVQMQQGDTLFVYADRLYYDGEEKHATLVRGASRNKVELRNKTVTLTTDSLDYDVVNEMGWYTTGGTLDDKVNTLTSQYGEYSPGTKLAKFRTDVLLVNNRDGYKLRTEELDYSTATHIADINTRTIIEGANDTIITTRGWYDTQTDHAQLTARSTITHRDSTNNVTWLEGDSIIYDKRTRMSRAYMFRDEAKQQQPMVLTDTARKIQLIGGYGEYNDSTRQALATEYPLLIEYSRPDTLFLRADTVLSTIVPQMVWPDSLAAEISAENRAWLSKITNPGQLADGLRAEIVPLPYGYYPAGPPSPIELPRGKWGLKYVQAKTNGATATDDNVPDDGITLADSSALQIQEPKVPRRIDRFGRDSAYMVPKDFHVARAIGRARFFNQDVQGVADTLIYSQYDSMLYMLRKPVVWSGERQVAGNRIDVHLNDSTADWAYLPQSGMLAEHVDEKFYNQLSGTKLKAWMADKKIRRLEVDGNVQVILLPEEKDSTYSKFVNAESSYLTIDFKEGEMDHLRMWPDVNGTVTPIGDVKPGSMYLQGFRWLEALRPVREWYGDRVRWIDDLGEVPEALEQWFREPAELKTDVPKPTEYKKLMRRDSTQ